MPSGSKKKRKAAKRKQRQLNSQQNNENWISSNELLIEENGSSPESEVEKQVEGKTKNDGVPTISTENENVSVKDVVSITKYVNLGAISVSNESYQQPEQRTVYSNEVLNGTSQGLNVNLLRELDSPFKNLSDLGSYCRDTIDHSSGKEVTSGPTQIPLKQPSSWMNCCGLFEVLTNSQRWF